jgi:hypothetical protein
MKLRILATAVCLLAPVALLAEAANLGGQWVLNIKESDWGKKKAPQNLVVNVEHQEPKLKYSGELTPSLEGQRVTFTFDGAVDGKEYRVREDNDERKIKVERVNDYTIKTTTTSLDGASTETATITIARDGKRLTRRITLKAPEGEATWTEVYDKAPAQAR